MWRADKNGTWYNSLHNLSHYSHNNYHISPEVSVQPILCCSDGDRFCGP